MKLVVLVVIGGLILSGCSPASGSEDQAQPTPSSSESAPSNNQEEVTTDVAGTGAGWQCNSQKDGLGEEFSCSSQATDKSRTIWTLTLLCSSDQRALHSINGMDYSFSDIIWDENQFDRAMVRIDSNEIEEWDFFVKADGRALVFASSAGDRMDEASSTWELLTRISSAETLGFKAFDAEGFPQSALFDVGDSVPIAATFAAMGCSR